MEEVIAGDGQTDAFRSGYTWGGARLNGRAPAASPAPVRSTGGPAITGALKKNISLAGREQRANITSS